VNGIGTVYTRAMDNRISQAVNKYSEDPRVQAVFVLSPKDDAEAVFRSSPNEGLLYVVICATEEQWGTIWDHTDGRIIPVKGASVELDLLDLSHHIAMTNPAPSSHYEA